MDLAAALRERGYERVYFHHIRRVGGTSLNETFFSLMSGHPKRVTNNIRRSASKSTNVLGCRIVGANHSELVTGKYLYGFSHYPAHSLLLPRKTFSLTLLRDPVSRIVSHYNMTLDYVSRGIKRSWVAMERPWLGRSIFEFCDNMPRSRLYAQLWMFSANLSPNEGVEAISRCDFILFNNTYMLDLQDLSEHLNLPLVMQRAHRGRRRVSITDSDMQRLNDIMRPEIDFVSKVRAGG